MKGFERMKWVTTVQNCNVELQKQQQTGKTSQAVRIRDRSVPEAAMKDSSKQKIYLS